MGQAIPETEAETRGLVIDMGWGDYRLLDAPNTRVTAEQVATLSAQNAIEAGASECRFGEMTGELLANLADGRWIEIAVDGAYEDVTAAVIG